MRRRRGRARDNRRRTNDRSARRATRGRGPDRRPSPDLGPCRRATRLGARVHVVVPAHGTVPPGPTPSRTPPAIGRRAQGDAPRRHQLLVGGRCPIARYHVGSVVRVIHDRHGSAIEEGVGQNIPVGEREQCFRRRREFARIVRAPASPQKARMLRVRDHWPVRRPHSLVGELPELARCLDERTSGSTRHGCP